MCGTALFLLCYFHQGGDFTQCQLPRSQVLASNEPLPETSAVWEGIRWGVSHLCCLYPVA